MTMMLKQTSTETPAAAFQELFGQGKILTKIKHPAIAELFLLQGLPENLIDTIIIRVF
jgi:hypothetical protein